MMPEFSFGLVIEGVDLADDDVVNTLYDAGVEDATFGVRDGSHVAYVDRAGDTLLDAVSGAVAELEAAHPALRVVGFDGKQLLTQSGVAELTGRTRQSIHQHIRGSRGGGFPPAVTWADETRPLWLRSDVARWSLGPADPAADSGAAEYAVLGAFILARGAAGCAGLSASALSFAIDRVLALEKGGGLHLVAALREMADRLERRSMAASRRAALDEMAEIIHQADGYDDEF